MSIENRKPIVSIIIPVYNTENYLADCLKSILDYGKNIEVICIDDGSTDNSYKVCEKIAKIDTRVKIIREENSGVSVARNRGIDEANGKWLFFVDSDDIVLPEYYSVIADIDEEIDICIFDTIWGKDYKYDGDGIKKNINFKEQDKDILISSMIKSQSFSKSARTSLRSPCFKIYNKAFIDKKNIRFPQKIKIGEDFLFNLIAISEADKISYRPKTVYKVSEREGSATHSYVEDIFENDLLFQKRLQEILIEYGYYDKFYKLFCGEVKSGIMRCLRKKIFYPQNNLDKNEKINEIEKILNEKIYCESMMERDNNIKRELILFLLRHKFVNLIDILLN